MQMSEELDKLKNLQDVLAEKYAIESKVEDKPKDLIGRTESLDRFKKEYIEINAENEAQKAKVSELRSALEEASKTHENKEKEMDSITTHREYEILDKEINKIKEEEETLRKDLLTEEKRLAELEDRLRSQESLIADTEKDVNEAKSSLDKELGGYKAQLTSLEAQEKEMSEGIDSETIIKFQRIIKRNSKGIVAVKGTVCDGCHMILPAQFANEVRKGEKILFCPYCSRILYYEDTEESASNFFTMDNVGSLADFDDEDLLDDDEDEIQDEFEDESEENDSKSMDYEE